MTRRKSLKGNRQAQRNFMARELHKKQYHGQKVPNKKKELKNVPIEEPDGCDFFDCRYPDCECDY